MDVRLPNGELIRGVPDTMSKADLVAKLRANGHDMSWVDGPDQPAVAPAEEAPVDDTVRMIGGKGGGRAIKQSELTGAMDDLANIPKLVGRSAARLGEGLTELPAAAARLPGQVVGAVADLPETIWEGVTGDSPLVRDIKAMNNPDAPRTPDRETYAGKLGKVTGGLAAPVTGSRPVQATREWFQDKEAQAVAALTPAARRAIELSLVESDEDGLHVGEGATDPWWWTANVIDVGVQAAPGMGATAVAARMGYAAKYRAVLGELSAQKIPQSVAIKAAEKQAMQAASRAAVISGGLTEGAIGGGQDASEVRATVESLDEETLMGYPGYLELREAGMTHEQARERVAADKAAATAISAGAVIGLTGAPMNAFFGRLTAKLGREVPEVAASTLAHRAGEVGKAALGEGVQEFGQEGAEQVIQNQQLAPITKPGAWDNVLENAITGFALGAVVGAGAASPALKGPKKTPKAGEPAPTTPAPPDAVGGAAAAYEAAEAALRAGMETAKDPNVRMKYADLQALKEAHQKAMVDYTRELMHAGMIDEKDQANVAAALKQAEAAGISATASKPAGGDISSARDAALEGVANAEMIDETDANDLITNKLAKVGPAGNMILTPKGRRQRKAAQERAKKEAESGQDKAQPAKKPAKTAQVKPAKKPAKLVLPAEKREVAATKAAARAARKAKPAKDLAAEKALAASKEADELKAGVEVAVDADTQLGSELTQAGFETKNPQMRDAFKSALDRARRARAGLPERTSGVVKAPKNASGVFVKAPNNNNLALPILKSKSAADGGNYEIGPDGKLTRANAAFRLKGKKVPGAPKNGALVNIGLNVNDGSKITQEAAIAALEKRGVKVTRRAVQTSNTEPTLVAHLDRALTPAEADAVSAELKQDAIAQLTPEEGTLHGPVKDKWGDFNPEFFLTMRGNAASAEQETVKFKHFSKATEDQIDLDPEQMGTGVKGAEAKRSGPKVISLYAEHGETEPDVSNGRNRFNVEIPKEDLYDGSADPQGLLAQAQVPYGLTQDKDGNMVPVGQRFDMNKFEELVRDAGFLGYHLPEASGILKGQARIFQKYPATREGANLDRAAAATRMKPKAKRADVERLLTEQERARLRDASAKRLVEIFNELPDGAEFAASALAGQAKRGWYRRSAEALTNVFGGDAPRFAALLAALSPKVPVEWNFRNAVAVWVGWDKAGRPTDRKAITSVMRENVFPSTSRIGKANILPAWINNTIRALTSEDPSTVTLSGPKVDSFAANLRGETERVTLDAWMANWAGVDQVLFKGEMNKAGDSPGMRPGYLAYAARVREAAEILSNRTGEPWTAAEVQETVWSWAKTLYEQAESYGALGTAREILDSKELTDELINATPDFAGLFEDPTVSATLAGTVYGPRAELSAESGRVARAQGKASSTSTQDVGHLRKAADRLDALRQARKDSEAETRAESAEDIAFAIRSIADIKSDPRVKEVSDERSTNDGYWVYLNAGYIYHGDPLSPSTAIHEYTVADLRRELKKVTKVGEAYSGAQRTGSGRGIPRADLEQIAERVKKELGVTAQIAETQADLPDYLQALIPEGADGVTGMFYEDPYTGETEIWYVRENLDSKFEAYENALHEAVGHMGLRAVLGKNYHRVMEDIRKSFPAQVRAAAKRNQINMEHSDPATRRRLQSLASEELVAYAAGQLLAKRGAASQMKLWRRIVAKIRDILRGVGLLNGYSSEDIEALIYRARDYFRKPAETRAQEIEYQSKMAAAMKQQPADAPQWLSPDEYVADDSDTTQPVGSEQITFSPDFDQIMGGKDDFFGQGEVNAFADGQRIGYVTLDQGDMTDTTWTPLYVYVNPRYRGKGVAQRMYKAISDRLRLKPAPAKVQTPAGRGMWDSFGRRNVAFSMKDTDTDNVVNLGDVRENQKLAVFHKGLMSQISGRAKAKADQLQQMDDEGLFAYDAGDRVYSHTRPNPITIKGRTAIEYKPGRIERLPAATLENMPQELKDASEVGATVPAYMVEYSDDLGTVQTTMPQWGIAGQYAGPQSAKPRREAAFAFKQGPTGNNDLDSFISKIGASPKTFRQRWDEFKADIKDRVIMGLFDEFHGIQRAGELAGITAADSGYMDARLSKNAAELTQTIIEHGPPVWDDGAPNIGPGMSLLSILKPLKGNVNLWLTYITARRADRLMGEGRENLFKANEIAAALDLGRQHPEFDIARAQYNKLQKGVLDFAEQSGVINAQGRALWEHADYIPFHRIVEGGTVKASANGGGGIGFVRNQIVKLTGGKQKIGDPLENIVRNWLALMDASLKANAGRMTVDGLNGTGLVTPYKGAIPSAPVVPFAAARQFLAQNPALAQTFSAIGLNPAALPPQAFAGLQQMVAQTGPVEDDVISVWRGGKREHWKVHDPMLMRSLQNIHSKAWAPIIKVLTYPKRIITKGITLTPQFMVKNFWRDVWHVFVQGAMSSTGTKVVVLPTDSLKGLVSTLRNDATAKGLLAGGGSFTEGYVNGMDMSGAAKVVRASLNRGKARGVLLDSPMKVWRFYKDLQAAAENANRVATYNKSRAAGLSRKESIFAARDLLDFSMRGNNPIAQLIVMSTPFMNARLQGLYRLGRGMKENFWAVALRGMMLTLASAALLARNYDDDRYKALLDEQKANYWHFFDVFEEGDHFQLPKPFEVGSIFGTIPEAIGDAMFTNSEEPDGTLQAAKLVGYTFGNTLNLAPQPQAVWPLLELAINKDTFTGSPILTQGDESVLPEDQRGPRTSPTYAALAEAMPDVAPDSMRSPKQLEHLGRGYLGNLQDYVLLASDAIVRKASGETAPPEKATQDIPGIRDFYKTGPARNDRHVVTMYDLASEAAKISASIKRNEDAETDEGDARVEKLETENAPLLDVADDFKSAAKSVTDLKKEQRQIQLDQSMTPAEKRAEIDEIQTEINDIAKDVYDLRPGGKLNPETAGELLIVPPAARATLLRKSGLSATADLLEQLA